MICAFYTGAIDDTKVLRNADDNRALIVRAVNAHDELIAALKAYHGFIDRLAASVMTRDASFSIVNSDIWPVIERTHALMKKLEET